MAGPRVGLVALGLFVFFDAASALRRSPASHRGGRAPANSGGQESRTSVAILLVGYTFQPTPPAWPSIKKHVLRPLGLSLGTAPDVFVCAFSVLGAVPPEVTRVYSFYAAWQVERAHECYRRVVAARTYDFYIKIRPDFRFLQDFPSLASMRRDRIHTRFRLAIGMQNLTSSHFSWDQCSGRCNGRPESAVGYVNDDMILVVPAPVSDRVFASNEEASGWRDRFLAPPNWLELRDDEWGWGESEFARHLLAAGVLTEPLAVVGYPLESAEDHSLMALTCADKPVPKESCGEAATKGGP